MIPSVSGTKGLKFDHQSKEDKHFWAGHCNLAIDNMNVLATAFSDRFGGAMENNLTNTVNNYFRDNLSYQSWEQGIDFLRDF